MVDVAEAVVVAAVVWVIREASVGDGVRGVVALYKAVPDSNDVCFPFSISRCR